MIPKRCGKRPKRSACEAMPNPGNAPEKGKPLSSIGAGARDSLIRHNAYGLTREWNAPARKGGRR